MNDIIKFVNQLPISDTIPRKNVLVPGIITDLIQKSKKVHSQKNKKKAILVGCTDSTDSTDSNVPVVAQPQSYTTLDKAVSDLINGKHQSRNRTIFQLCYMRDFFQSGNQSFPLVMFYFPLFIETINENPNKFSKNTIAVSQILTEYYKNGDIQGFLDAFDKTGKYFNEIYTTSIPHFENGRYSFLYGSFVPSLIQYHIETNPLNFTFWISPQTNSSSSTITFANTPKDMSEKIIKTFEWLQEIFPESKKLNYDIKYFNIPLKKLLPKIPNEFLTPRNINSGLSYTYTNSDKRQIVIFREEEHLKVLIHEFLHTYKCHNAIDRNKKIMNFLDSINVETTPIFTDMKLDPHIPKNKLELDINYIGTRNPNEALTEITANILNIIRIMSENGDKPDTFLKYISIERKFSLFQCAKILYHYGIIDVNNLSTPIKQTTNVIPYFVFRAMLYHDLSKLFNFYDKQGGLCYFGASDGTPIIEDMLSHFSAEFITDINKLIRHTITISKNSPTLMNTLRMTVFG